MKTQITKIVKSVTKQKNQNEVDYLKGTISLSEPLALWSHPKPSLIPSQHGATASVGTRWHTKPKNQTRIGNEH